MNFFKVQAVVESLSRLPLSDGEETLDASLSRRAFELASAATFRRVHTESPRLPT